MKEDLLPIGMITEKTIATVDIPKDSLIDMTMVEVDDRATVTRLRRRQNSMKL